MELTILSRYNLKRRVTELPPITSEVFTEKVLAAQASSSAAATKASYERTCTACAKTYFSENAYHNHVGSQKHRARVAHVRAGGNGQLNDDSSSMQNSSLARDRSPQEDSEGEEDFQELIEGIKGSSLTEGIKDSRKSSQQQGSTGALGNVRTTTTASTTSEAPSIPVTQPEMSLQRCLFCNYGSPTTPLNVVHMERIHGMFIPERQYLVDLDGLITSLHEKIYEFHECLYCGRLKPTVFGLQTHMRDKGHCKIRFDTEDEQLEIGEFYDFTSTYSDMADEVSDDEVSGGVNLRSKSTTDKDEDMEDADGWETDSSASSLDSADLTAVPLDQHTHQYEKLDRHPHHSSQDPRPHHNRDGWHSHAHKHAHAVFYSDYELHLPSGRSVGHRSLSKYYRQNLHNHPSPAERLEQYAIEAAANSDSEDGDHQVAQRNYGERGRAVMSRANGGTGMIGVSEQRKREVKATEKRARKVEDHERRLFQWGNNRQSNFQKHFRVCSTPFIARPFTHANICLRIRFCSRSSDFIVLFIINCLLWSLL
jgi:pre-60S factor REI1